MQPPSTARIQWPAERSGQPRDRPGRHRPFGHDSTGGPIWPICAACSAATRSTVRCAESALYGWSKITRITA